MDGHRLEVSCFTGKVHFELSIERIILQELTIWHCATPKYRNVPKHKAAPLHDAESGSWYTTIEPGLPGPSRKGAYEGPTAPDAVGPFIFLLGVGVLYHVWGESARLWNYYNKSIDVKARYRRDVTEKPLENSRGFFVAVSYSAA